MAIGKTSVDFVLRKLEGNFALTQSMRERIGVLVVTWGIFECNLEPVLWQITGETPTEVRPTTDGQPVSEWLRRFRASCGTLNNKLAQAGSQVCDTAEDLLVFRNAVIHGWIIPPAVGGPAFINNPRWFREKRKREPTDAHISDRTLEMAIEAVDVLTETIVLISGAVADQINFDKIMSDEFFGRLKVAKSYAGELRHLTALMNHEKS